MKDESTATENESIDLLTEETQRRSFFLRSAGLFLASLVGVKLMKVSGQDNSIPQVLDGKRGNRILDALYSLKKLVTPSDNSALKRKITQQDELLAKSKHLIKMTVTPEQQELLQQVRTYAAMITIDQKKGIVEFQEDKESGRPNLKIGKLESILLKQPQVSASSMFDFMPYTVESLLNQAADLLDRTLKDRAEYDDKAIKLFYLALELNEFRELDLILQKQIGAGLYITEVSKVENDHKIQGISHEKLVESETQLNKLVNEQFSTKSIEYQQDSLRRMNYAGYYYTGFISDPNGTPAVHHPVQFDGETAGVKDHVSIGSLRMNLFNLSVQKEQNEIQLRSIHSNALSAATQKQFFAEKLKFEQKNLSLKLDRDHVLRMTYATKLNSLLYEEDGVLNYLKRMKPLEERYMNDFEQADARLRAASIGLKAIYKFFDPLPVLKEGYVQYYDDCIVWNRKAINHVNKVCQNQVIDNFSFSLRSVAGSKEEFNSGMNKGQWSFKISKDFFKNKFQVRLLGISVSIVGLNKSYLEPYNLDGCFRAVFTRHGNPSYYFKDGSAETLNLRGFPNIPHLSIGNVYTINSNHMTETVGAQVLGNLSPIGDWQLELHPTLRPFSYVRRRNGKVRKVSDPDLAFSPDENDTEDKQVIDSPKNAEPVSGTSNQKPLFNTTDFLDLKLNFHVAYVV